MSNLTWLRQLTAEKASQIMDLAEDYWDVITESNPSMPAELERDSDSLGKAAVISTLGLMTYIPSMSRQLADSFGRTAGVKTGVRNHVDGPDEGYMTRISRGIELSAQLIQQWEQMGDGEPRVTEQDSTKELMMFKDLFKGNLREKLMVEKKSRAAAQEESYGNLLTPEGE